MLLDKLNGNSYPVEFRGFNRASAFPASLLERNGNPAFSQLFPVFIKTSISRGKPL